MHNQPSGTVAERAAWWQQAVSKQVRLEPALSAQIPTGAFLCVLPENDPEVARFSLLQTDLHEGEVALVVVVGGPEAFELIVVSDDLLDDPALSGLSFGDAPPEPF